MSTGFLPVILMSTNAVLARSGCAGLAFGMRCDSRSKRIFLRMLEIVDLQVYIQLRPIQMVTMKQLNVLYGLQRLLMKVGVILIAEKVLPSLHEEPDAERGDILNAYGNSFATLE